MRYIVVFVFFLLSVFSYSDDCKKIGVNLAKKFHPELSRDPLHLIACKVWPYSPDKILVAIGLVSDILDKKNNDTLYDLDVFVLRTDNYAVIAHLYEKKAFADDAFYTDEITIDTARYNLSSTNRAFGVLFYKKEHGYGRESSENILSLYYLKDNALHRVLRGLALSEQYGVWEDRAVYCEGTFNRIFGLVNIANQKTNGFNNLKITQFIEKSKFKGAGPKDCEEVSDGREESSFTLKYNGKKYVISEKHFGTGFDPGFWNVNPD